MQDSDELWKLAPLKIRIGKRVIEEKPITYYIEASKPDKYEGYGTLEWKDNSKQVELIALSLIAIFITGILLIFFYTR